MSDKLSIIKAPRKVLPLIVFSQFAGTSLWFATNAVAPELIIAYQLGQGAIADFTSIIQFGFIIGTLCFAIFTIADRFSPVKVFFISSLLASFFNGAIIFPGIGSELLFIFRFMCGFFLAGIYPVGMKIAADWYSGKLGKALGYLVGALVLGTAFPHIVNTLPFNLDWQKLILFVSTLALTGGIVLLAFLSDGPYRKKAQKFKPTAIKEIFKIKEFRLSSFGYFGHMWELYAFYAFTPMALQYFNEMNGADINISLWSFVIIALGFFGCSGGGLISIKIGSARVAFGQLLASLICCLLSPFIYSLCMPLFLTVLMIWGITVVGDSPQYSTLSAKTAPKEWIGSALTIMNCIGFAITIASIQLVKFIDLHYSFKYALFFLAIGPIFGLVSIYGLLEKKY